MVNEDKAKRIAPVHQGGSERMLRQPLIKYTTRRMRQLAMEYPIKLMFGQESVVRIKVMPEFIVRDSTEKA